MLDGLPEGEGTLNWTLTNCVYKGHFHLGKYDGSGTFSWNATGDKLVAEFSSGAPTTGTYTYANTMCYKGTFNSDWLFDGTGSFDWNQYNADGTVKAYGWLYEGTFSKGTIIGCTGKTTFAVARDGSKGFGVYSFTGVNDGFPGIKKGQNGEGEIHFDDGSVYTGGINYSADGSFLRYGHGTQTFYAVSHYRASVVGGDYNDLWYAYVGEFDGINHGWIYGNGVNYFCDSSLKPTGYIKGEWNGTSRIASWIGTWDDSYLLDDWKSTAEVSYTDGYYQTIKGKIAAITATDLSDWVLLVGHSHFTNWTSSYDDLLANGIKSVNLGCGGSTADWWQNDTNMALLDKLPSAPKMIVLAVGNNDLGAGATVEAATASCESLIAKMHAKFPTSIIAFKSMFVSPYYLEEGSLCSGADMKNVNEAVSAYISAGSFDGKVTYLDLHTFDYNTSATSGKYYFAEDNAYLYEDIWEGDLTHLNAAKGYPLFTTAMTNGINAILGK